jgi:hypothetical protein
MKDRVGWKFDRPRERSRRADAEVSLEETEVPVRSMNDLQAQLQAAFEFQRRGKPNATINTRHILFVVGAFGKLKEQVARRVRPVTGSARNQFSRITSCSNTSPRRTYGVRAEPEFIGRLPVGRRENPTRTIYSTSAKYSEGSLLRQYERALAPTE